jgi:hypothetical protein
MGILRKVLSGIGQQHSPPWQSGLERIPEKRILASIVNEENRLQSGSNSKDTRIDVATL